MNERLWCRKAAMALVPVGVLMGSGAGANPVVTASLVDPTVMTTGLDIHDTFQVSVAISSNTSGEMPGVGVLEFQYEGSKLELQGASGTLAGGGLGQAMVGIPVNIGEGMSATWVVLFGNLSNANPMPPLVTVTFAVVGGPGPFDVDLVVPEGSSDPRGIGVAPALLANTAMAPIPSATTDSSGTQGIPGPAQADSWMLTEP